ncbi:uncharacterized protein METZ01_LOCUS26182 [marine metagenome]|uniref:Uncharacterized protein n=1 Tax=marine metagenome TaxID=408172 RepID=A0A381Q349_9ZZZZ
MGLSRRFKIIKSGHFAIDSFCNGSCFPGRGFRFIMKMDLKMLCIKGMPVKFRMVVFDLGKQK